MPALELITMFSSFYVNLSAIDLQSVRQQRQFISSREAFGLNWGANDGRPLRRKALANHRVELPTMVKGPLAFTVLDFTFQQATSISWGRKGCKSPIVASFLFVCVLLTDCGGKMCYNSGKLDLATCSCKCMVGYSGDNCEKREINQVVFVLNTGAYRLNSRK